MLYSFECNVCYREFLIDSEPFHPPETPKCCGENTLRQYKARIDTSGCRDHDQVPQEHQVCTFERSVSKDKARRVEKAYLTERDNKRKAYREGDGAKTMRQTHSIPAELYHGKVRETGDKNYWNDSSNLKKHNMWKVDKK